MGKRERRAELYLTECVKARGGTTRKWSAQGKVGVPDRIVFLPGQVWFVEVKTSDGYCSAAQIREQQYLDSLGANVCTVFGKGGVDLFMEDVDAGTYKSTKHNSELSRYSQEGSSKLEP